MYHIIIKYMIHVSQISVFSNSCEKLLLIQHPDENGHPKVINLPAIPKKMLVTGYRSQKCKNGFPAILK